MATDTSRVAFVANVQTDAMGTAVAATYPPTLPGDRLDSINLALSAGEGAAAPSTINVAVYATTRKPASVAEAQNGQQIFALTNFPGIPALLDSAPEPTVTTTYRDRIPVIWDIDQAHRYISVVVSSPSTVQVFGAVFLDIFRPKPAG